MTNRKSFLSNAAQSTLSSSLAQAASTVNVTTTTAFPAVPFYAVIDPDKDAKREVVRATAKTATTLTVVRGEDNSSDVAHDSGAVIAVVPVAAHWTDINDRVDGHTHSGASADGVQIATSSLTGHTKAAHDALGIDAAALDGRSPSEYADVGDVKMTARSTAPTSWLLCRGQAVSRTTYADLFAAIGTTYGIGDGSTTFNVPDLQAKFPVGVSASDPAYDLGDTGGAAEHTLTTAELPSHAHSGPSHAHSAGNLATATDGDHRHGYQTPSTGGSGFGFANADNSYATQQTEFAGDHGHNVTGSTAASGTGNTGSTGSGTAHENRPPFLALNFIIFAGA